MTRAAQRSFREIGRLDAGTPLNAVIGAARCLAESTRACIERAIDEGRVALANVLNYSYEEVQGARTRSLEHLFGLPSPAPDRFVPPKWTVGWDTSVDTALVLACDEARALVPHVGFALPFDLNAFAPAHNRAYVKDWTGDPSRDAAGNRVKRLFRDVPLLRAARVGLGQHGEALPQPSTRADFAAARALLTEGETDRDVLFVQSYARDTGEVMTILAVPIFVKGQRWGGAVIGWADP